MTDTPASRVVEDRPSRGAVQAELTADAAAKIEIGWFYVEQVSDLTEMVEAIAIGLRIAAG